MGHYPHITGEQNQCSIFLTGCTLYQLQTHHIYRVRLSRHKYTQVMQCIMPID